MGASNDAAEEAQKAEEERRAQVLATQQAIESIYSDPKREMQIKDLIAATNQFLSQDLSRKNSEASRNLKFALARGGQSGGSYDVDRRRDLGENFLRGALEVERRSQAAGQSLRQADQDSKLALFSQAAAGLDMTTAARNAGEAMRSNAGLAKSNALQSGLGDLFSGFADIYKMSRERAGKDAAQKYEYPYGGNPYGANPYFAGSGP
jgi:hypothetical protein